MNIPSYSIELRFQNGVPRFKFRTKRSILRRFDYYGDGLSVWGKSADFLSDPKFREAYELGMNSGHHIGREHGSSADIHIEWRVMVCLWAAQHAKHLPGDFVECGVNTGIYSRAVCKYVDFNSTGKTFFLFDTYRGIPENQAGDEVERVRRMNTRSYEECYELAKANFSAYPKAVLVRGTVPETLSSVEIERVSYLSLDMNISAPEVAALEYFWDKLSIGAPVLLDDYGFREYQSQKAVCDRFAKLKGVEILTMPTGQGLLIKA